MGDRSFMAGASGRVMRVGLTRRKFLDPEACSEYIAQMERVGREPYTLPRALRHKDRIAEENFDGMQCFTIRPPDDESPADGGKRILYLHGGSYFAPPNILHWRMLLRLSGLTGALIDLPLYPRAPLRTCSAAYEAIGELWRRRSYDVIMGDSAGGGLALGFAQTLDVPAPQVILLSPWLDGTLSNPDIAEYEPLDAVLGSYGLRRMAKLWAGAIDVSDPRVSPINGGTGAINDLTLLVGTHEIFYPDVMKLAEMFERSGENCRIIKGEKLGHVWCCYPMKEGREAIEQLAGIINENSGEHL